MKLHLASTLIISVAAAAHPLTVQYLGRVNPSTKELTWPGTGVSFTFTGTSATIDITAINGNNSVDLFIDGSTEPTTVIANLTGSSISTPAGLHRGYHTVELRKRSEYVLGTFVVGDITTDGTLHPTPNSAHTRKIEFVGDSITVGYGLDGVYPCVNTAALEDNPKTYAALAAKALRADYSIVAWSGIGVVRNYLGTPPNTQPVMPDLYTRYVPSDADNTYTFPRSWIPDVVVINLGTNDFGYVATNASTGQPYNAREPLDMEVYKAAMVKLVREIQRHYPDAQFFLLTSPMLSDSYPSTKDAQHTTQFHALEAVVEQIGHHKAHLVNWPTQGSSMGCDNHPNAATHAAEGEVLAMAIRTVLGWWW